MVNPNTFVPLNEVYYAAHKCWEKLEPDKPGSFGLYLNAVKKGLPAQLFYQFASEIKQDLSVRNPGAVFNKKVADYFLERRKGGVNG